MSCSTVKDCNAPWTWCLVEANGFLRVCCFGSASIGKIDSEKPTPGALDEAWNSATMMSLRATLSAGQVHTICRNASCKYVEGTKQSAGAESVLQEVPEAFDESWYVRSYHDVEAGLTNGHWKSGREHFMRFGHLEKRALNAVEYARMADAAKAASATLTSQSIPDFSATLSWSEPVRDEAPLLTARIAARNTGRAVWSESFRGGARVFDRLLDLEKRLPIREYRCEKTGAVSPGEALDFSLSIPVEDLPQGRAFIVFDLFREDSGVWLSTGGLETRIQPLVLGVHRDGNGLKALTVVAD